MKAPCPGCFCVKGIPDMIINQDHEAYRERWRSIGTGRFNGAFFYSKEICRNMIPLIQTDRNWITILVPNVAVDHSIVFIHNNLHPENYDWLQTYGYKDLILVCGVPETCEKVAHLGTPIYLPLSIDVEYVKQFKTAKTRKIAYAGRRAKRRNAKLPKYIDYIEGIKREEFLKLIAKYDTVYAVGRSAIEAKALGCKLKAYDPRFPKVSFWKVIDNKTAAKMLQEKLDEIDGKGIR